MARARIRRRGYLEQLPSGSVRAVVFVGTDLLTGRPRYLRETHRTAGEAEVALTKLLRYVDQQQHPKSAITVREAVEQRMGELLVGAARNSHGRPRSSPAAITDAADIPGPASVAGSVATAAPGSMPDSAPAIFPGGGIYLSFPGLGDR
jgi:hypothetical protein